MTTAARAAQAAQVRFSLHRYEHDPDADSFGMEAAEKLAVPPDRVYKTLVVQVDGKRLVLAVLPVTGRLDLKKLAAAGGAKAELADPAAAERATGYVLGGVNPPGVRKKLPTFVDASAAGQATIYVIAGRRGMQMELSPADLLGLADGVAAEVTAG